MSDDPTDSTSIPGARLLAVIPLELRWRDLDAFNHVNNSSFLTYLEEARLRWLGQFDGAWLSDSCAPVLASVLLNYRRQLEWPGDITIELYAERVGRSSLTIAHRILTADDPQQLVADGHVVMVWIDPRTGKSILLPDAVRQVCESTKP